MFIDGQAALVVLGVMLVAVSAAMVCMRLVRVQRARVREAALAKERADLIFDAEIRRVLLRVRGNRSV